MNLRTIGIVGIAAFLGICLALGTGNRTSAQIGVSQDEQLHEISIQQIGRFQAMMRSDSLYLFDTATGEGWRLRGNEWIPAVKPKN